MKTILIAKFALIFSLTTCFALGQVGFNNPNPDPSSILDLTAVDKGFLIPRLTTSQRDAISSPGRSLMVFDATEGRFYFYDGGLWYALNEWMKIAGSNNVSLSGNATLTGSINASTFSASGNISGVNVSVTGTGTSANVIVDNAINATTIAASGTIAAGNYALNSNGNGPVPAGGDLIGDPTAFSEADKLWKSLQLKIIAFVNENKGFAKFDNFFSQRFNWKK